MRQGENGQSHGSHHIQKYRGIRTTTAFKCRTSTFMALSISLESHAGSGGSWDIWSGLEPSDSSIRMVTLCTDAVPVFLPNTCWLKEEKRERHVNRQPYPKDHTIIDKSNTSIMNVCSYFQTARVRYLAAWYLSTWTRSPQRSLTNMRV